MDETAQIHIRIPRITWLRLHNEIEQGKMNEVISNIISSYFLNKDSIETDDQKVQREIKEIETQIDNLQKKRVERIVVFQTIQKRKQTEEIQKLELAEKEERKKYCKHCGTLISLKFDKIGSTFQYCRSCWVESKEFDDLRFKRTQQQERAI